MWPDLKHVLKIYVLNKFLMENFIFCSAFRSNQEIYLHKFLFIFVPAAFLSVFVVKYLQSW